MPAEVIFVISPIVFFNEISPMVTTYDTSVVHRFDSAIRHEWIETNGLGGYASSTIINAHTRRYHGLLVAATQPPVGRVVLLSKLDETIHAQGQRHELGCNRYRGAVYPEGYIYQQRFEKDLFPRFTYRIQNILLQKTIVAVHGENTTLILYEVLDAPATFTLELLPLIASRDFHNIGHANGSINPIGLYDGQVFRTRSYDDSPELFMGISHAWYEARPDWYFHLEYNEELRRGMHAEEDLFSPGRFYVNLSAGAKFGIIASTENPAGRDPWALYERETLRRLELIEQSRSASPLVRSLTLAADQFVVRRGSGETTILAGYPWFTDWGRDTMIALPGLCLSTGRHAEARRILHLFASHISQGMIPNRFPDHGDQPEYNNIDGTLWFFIAAWRYYEATQDQAFVREVLLPAFREILDWHDKGTRFRICTDTDGLLSGGTEGVQLTWMDAKAGNWVVTPRRGKAVEVNALWYNAWEIFREFAALCGDEMASQTASDRAFAIRKAFVLGFWNEDKQYLYDLIDEQGVKDDAIRPNQIFAVSLPFPLLSPVQAASVLHKVEESLLTPVGLRSLSPDHADYQPHYKGDRFARDGAYHQGTVWGWLSGPYIDALIKVRGPIGREIAREMLRNMEAHLHESGIGSISEIFDAEYPYEPKGCIAQAWSVGELLRVCAAYKLMEPDKKSSGLNTTDHSIFTRRGMASYFATAMPEIHQRQGFIGN
ncbi:MAG: glycogen debranching protein [Bacteroidetes bacterium]|nr:MAG: glycogen debranching protein [Bacteroidota bacterium]